MRLCSIASGSSGNCIYAGSDQTHILVDAGLSGKRIEKGMNELELSVKDTSGIFVTHEHADHISGLGVLARRYSVPIYATKGTIQAIRADKKVGEIPDDLFHEIEIDKEVQIKDLTIYPFEISHDAAQPAGYRISNNGKSVAIATDFGCFNEYIVDKLQGLDVLLLEANHDINMLQVGSYPYYLKQRILGRRGHLSNEASGQLLSRLLHDNMKAVMLGHLSRENNYEELAYETVRLEVNMADNPYKADDFPIMVAKRDQNSQVLIA